MSLDHTDAMLGVYEQNKFDLLKDVFIWVYERSAARYAATRQSWGNLIRSDCATALPLAKSSVRWCVNA